MSAAPFWIASAICAAAFLALGLAVSRLPLSGIDAWGAGLRGAYSGPARLFTLSGRALPLTAAGAVATVLYLILHLNTFVPLAIAGAQLLSQVTVEAFKALFRRVRPDYWLFGKELGLSYPSGHATTAVVFFGGWAVVLASYPPVRAPQFAIVALLVLWAAGIDYSRLALGAHYISDVLGGTLFGLAVLFAMIALARHFGVAPLAV